MTTPRPPLLRRFRTWFKRDKPRANQLHRTESTSSYMQQRRNIFVNMEPPRSEYDSTGRRIDRHYVSNRVRTAKYTSVNFVPKNLFEQFRNVANLYFLFLVILQCIPIFGVTEPAVSAMPLIAILIITAIKDAIEDWKRNQSDQKVNNSTTRTLSHWRNVNIPEMTRGRGHFLLVILGFFCTIAGVDNKYSHAYLVSRQPKSKDEDKLPLTARAQQAARRTSRIPITIAMAAAAATSTAATVVQAPTSPLSPASPLSPTSRSAEIMNTVRQRSDTFRTELTQMFRKKPYRPGAIPHSVLYRAETNETQRRPSTHNGSNLSCAETYPGDPPAPSCSVRWQEDVRWQDVRVGDFVMIRDNEDVPADIIILSTSDEENNLCYVETQNLDGETNLKVRQGLPGTTEISTVHDCERAKFYIESELPHVDLYRYSAVLRWHIERDANATHPEVYHEKADAITYNNLLLRGSVLRNTEWAIGIVVYTGSDTKIMLNSGQTPSKRSKMAKATNPHVIANFCILAVICVVSSIMDSVQFDGSGSSRHFDFGIEGTNASYSGFLTFWVTLILYQNIVPISLYISVEIVKTFAAYFIYADIDMYHEATDTPCVPKTWNISDDLGQIEYVFSDKTGTLTQNVMEYRKCTINGVSYGLGVTEAQKGAAKRVNLSEKGPASNLDAHDRETGVHALGGDEDGDDDLDQLRKEMLEKQANLFANPHVSPRPTFVDPQLFDDLAQTNSPQAMAIQQFLLSLALCHTVIAEHSSEEPGQIDYKAQSPDEAALVATARDLGFVFQSSKNRTLNVTVMGVPKQFELLNVLEFSSKRKRMSVIIKPHDSNKRLLLCKGADSVIFERLCNAFGEQKDLEDAQAALRKSTTAHLDAYATEGLRTLCLAYRFVSDEEYVQWNSRFQDASASIHNREEIMEALSEEIEREMLLMGGTAIEDRLQDGVPETIAELSKSGIKLWVLTGDKTETAINIGFACNLLTHDMDLLQVKAQTREETIPQLQRAFEQSQAENARRCALVIDGTTLKYALEPELQHDLLALGTQCASVICCRVSPKQKAQVVSLVKKGLDVMTLAIGDGANDVSMIQEANIGVGISGVEGRQAVMASDYAIAQFRFLRKLLLVHGRWSYLRTADMIMGFFFKNIVWTFVLFWYQIFCQFNGTMMFDYALLTLYNLIFTSLPIIFLGIWDQDLSADISLRYPELYRIGLRNDKFRRWRFWFTVVGSIFQSSVCFFFPYMLLVAGAVDPHGYDQNGVYEIGTIVSSMAACVANFFVAFSMFSYTWIQVGVIALSILAYYAFIAVYSQFNTFVFAGQIRLFGTGMYWLVFLLTIVAAFLPWVAAEHYMHQYHPYDNDIIREIELVQKRPRKDPSSSQNDAIHDTKDA